MGAIVYPYYRYCSFKKSDKAFVWFVTIIFRHHGFRGGKGCALAQTTPAPRLFPCALSILGLTPQATRL